MSTYHDRSKLTRRDFMRLTGGSALALGAVPWLTTCGDPSGPGGQNPLRIPPEVSPGGLVLTPQPGSVDLGGGATSPAFGYNGSFPGPTIKARQGDNLSIRLQNSLAQPTTIHWHGMIVPSAADGHPQQAVQPAGSYTYQFSIAQRACMNWYHPHPHMLTGEQIYKGLAGAFIIRDAEEDALGLPSGAHELPLILRDAKLDASGNLQFGSATTIFMGDFPLVNGVRDAGIDVEATRYRLRILNGANARVFRLTLSNSQPMTLIGNDGGLLASATQQSILDLGPAERLDLLVDFSSLNVNDTVTLRDSTGNFDLLKFIVTARGSSPGALPQALSTITPLANPVTTRSFSFNGANAVNGITFDMNRVDFQVPFGDVELWRFSTNSNAPHPIHVHGGLFQVQTRTGGRGQVFPWERGWKDTVLMQDAETVEVLIKFETYRGLYILHCHRLDHEDGGMMLNFEVV